MRKSILMALLCFFAVVAITGCACNKPSGLLKDFQLQPIDKEAYKAKVDSFMIILDASASMDNCYKDSNRMNTAKAIVGNLNRSLPEMSINGALRSFGHSPAVSGDKTMLIYGPATYSTAGFQSGLEKITKAGGNSPMSAALDAAGEDLASTQGKIALIIVSDGEDMKEEAVDSAKKLKDQFGERLCIYTIHVGDNAAGGAFLGKIAQAGGCGYAKSDGDLASSDGMYAFVKDVFLEERLDADGDGVYDDQDTCANTPSGVKVDTKGCPVDSDDDGVADYMDQCPSTPAYVQVDRAGCPVDTDQDGVADYMDKCPNTRQDAKVDTQGCPLDSDGDGVVDYLDNCPDTPKDTEVDYSGCPMPKATKSAKVTSAGTWLYEDIQYKTGSAKIDPASYAVLDEIADLLTKNRDFKVEIQGHTDNTGSQAMNMKLSKDRANSVAAYLVNKGVTADQLTTEGYGPSRPIASNDTAAGRAKNRRVELKPIK